MRRHERPLKRTNPSGKTVWIARWTDRHGARSSAGTFPTRGQAQDAIDAAYDRDALGPARPDTVGTYAETWTTRHPRAPRTNTTNDGRVNAVLDVKLERVPLRDWRFADLRRRHVTELVDVMLREQGRAAAGAQNILRTLSAMAEDAIHDEVLDVNPFRGVKVRANDPRVQKAPKALRVWGWADMHRFAVCAGTARTSKDPGRPGEMDRWRPVYAEPMVRTLADCGLRIGELLPLERRDLKGPGACDEAGCTVTGAHLHVRRTAHEGEIQSGTKREHLAGDGWSHGRVVPVPAGLEALLVAMPKRIDTWLLFPTPRGALWREDNFRRDVWEPARKAAGIDPTRHEFRHSWVSLLRAAGVDPADLAAMAGHTVETATARYTHALGRSYDAAREAVGQ